MKDFQKKLAINLRKHGRSMSTKMLSKLSGVSERYVRLIVTGESNPSVLTILKICDALNVEIVDLLQNMENVVICQKHGTIQDECDTRFLPNAYSAKYNHCLNCAIDARKEEIESGNFVGYSGTYFTQEEIGLLLDENLGNIYQIEHKAIAKLKRNTIITNTKPEDYLD